LRATVDLEHEWCGPRVDLLARRTPQFLAIALVERCDERLATQVIPDDNERVAVERWRRAFAKRVAHLLVAEILLPEQLPVHVVGIEPERLKVGVDTLAIRDR